MTATGRGAASVPITVSPDNASPAPAGHKCGRKTNACSPSVTSEIARTAPIRRRSVERRMQGIVAMCRVRVISFTSARKSGASAFAARCFAATADRRDIISVQIMAGWGGILLLAVIGVGFGIVSVVISRFLGPRNPTPEKLAAYECGMPPVGDARERQSVKFYLIAMIFLLFDIEVAFLVSVGAGDARSCRGPGLIQIVVFFLILVVGYIYIWRKGVLDWGPEFDPDYKHPPKPGPAVVKRYRYGTRN